MSLQYGELVQQQSSHPHNMANFSPLTTEIGLPVWGNPANFNRFCVLASLLQRRRSPRPTKLCMMFAVSWAGTLNIHFGGLLPPDGILPHAKFTLRPSLAFSYIGSVTGTARHSSSRRQLNLAAWYTRNGITEPSQRAPPVFGWAVITLGIGPHSSILFFSHVRRILSSYCYIFCALCHFL